MSLRDPLWTARARLLAAGGSKAAKGREELLADPKMAWAEDFTDGHVRGIGVAEVLGALGLVLPWLLDVARVLIPLAALGLAIMMALALVAHARRGEVKQAPPINTVPFVLAVSAAAIRFSQL